MSGTGPGLLDRRLLFVTGKGGVGKTSIAAGLALLSAQRGRRTLVCEIDAKGDLADSFECGRAVVRATRGGPEPAGHGHGHRGVAARSTCDCS